MAKVTIEYDTLEKTVAVNMDGKNIPNVIGVSFSKYYDDEDCGMMIETADKSKRESDGFIYREMISASDSRESVKLEREGATASHNGEILTLKKPLYPSFKGLRKNSK